MRIVVRGADARTARDAQAQLAAAGFEASALIGDGPAPDGEDVCIVAGDIAAAAPAPLLRLAAFAYAAPPPLGLRTLEGFSGAVALDAPSKLLTMQIDAALRLAIIEEERNRRAATAAALKAPTPRLLETRRPRALYIGAPSAMFLALERSFTTHGGLVAAAFSSFSGFDHLHDEPFDAVVLNGAENPATAISLCAALRRNAALYYLPTMLVTAQGDGATAAAAIERGASAVTEATAPCGPALGWLFEAMRRERRRRSAEHDVRAMRDLMGDARTGLFQRPAFDVHLARLAADHHASGRPMSLAALRVLPAHGARQPDAETWRRGFNEIASLACRLMRDADCGAAVGGDLIAIALPASDLKAARRTAERIASVAECTAFAAGDNSAGPLVFEQTAVELQPGESGPGLLARALRGLEAEDIPA